MKPIKIKKDLVKNNICNNVVAKLWDSNIVFKIKYNLLYDFETKTVERQVIFSRITSEVVTNARNKF